MTSPATSNRDEIAMVVRELVASIKEVEGGAAAVPPDAVLFSNGGDPSPFEFDSLDALDLALGLQERFDPDGERFRAFLSGDVDPAGLATVDRVVAYVMLVMNGNGQQDGTAAEAVSIGQDR